MKQSTLKTPQVLRKPIVDNFSRVSPALCWKSDRHVEIRQHAVFLLSALFLVFYTLGYSAPKKAADLAGRGLSGPVWSPDDRFLAYTTVDFDELYVIELNEIKAKQSLYRVANLENVGRRFIFSPGEERLVHRSLAGAIKGAPDRIVSTSYFSRDTIMLSHNNGPILGPYLIENKIFVRESLTKPLQALDGSPWSRSITLDEGELTVKNSSGKRTYNSPSGDPVEGYEISPDGSFVAAVLRVNSEQVVRVIDIETGAVTDLGNGRWPSWSGNSQRLAFVRDKIEVKFAELIVHDITSGQSRSVMGVNQFWPDEPALNSDGTRIAFVHQGEIYITEVTGF